MAHIVPLYSAPVYRPYTLTQGAPYTFQQYSSSSYPSNSYDPGTAPPMTMQRYLVNSAAYPGIDRIWNRTTPTRDPLNR